MAFPGIDSPGNPVILMQQESGIGDGSLGWGSTEGWKRGEASPEIR